MNKYFRFYCILFSVLIGSNATMAQTNKRIELPLANSNSEMFNIPIAEKGVILLSQTSSNSFNLRKYNTDLELDWNINGTIGNNLDYVTHCYDGKHVYLLFSKYKSNSYEIVKVFPGPGFIEKYQIFSIDKVEISDFKATNNVVFLSGMVKNNPILFYTDLVNKKSKVLPTAFKTNAEIQSMEIDTLKHQVNITFAVGRVKDYQLVIKSFGEDGNAISEIQLDPEQEMAMMNGKLNNMNDSTQLMFGTYGYKNTLGSQKGPYSQGIYQTKITSSEIVNTKYYDFTDFKNFFAYLNPKQRERQEKKVKDKKEKGKDMKLDYRMLVHDVVENNGNYILVAEAFYPEYKYMNNSPYGFGSFDTFSPFYSSFYNPYRWGYGNWGLYSPFSNYYGYRGNGNREIFDGWKYSHAIIAAFDKQGNLLWDSNIELKNIKTPTLKERVKSTINGSQITLSYSSNGEIYTQTIENGKVIEQLKSKPITTQKEGDSVKKTTSDDIELWYGNYFIASGIQRISNTEEGKRNVFYLNKVSF